LSKLKTIEKNLVILHRCEHNEACKILPVIKNYQSSGKYCQNTFGDTFLLHPVEHTVKRNDLFHNTVSTVKNHNQESSKVNTNEQINTN